MSDPSFLPQLLIQGPVSSMQAVFAPLPYNSDLQALYPNINSPLPLLQVSHYPPSSSLPTPPPLNLPEHISQITRNIIFTQTDNECLSEAYETSDGRNEQNDISELTDLKELKFL